jgi:hypothetical protein
MEVWKDVIGFPGYQVSNTGKVKSLNYQHTKQEQILIPLQHEGGYFVASLWKEKRHYKRYIHRLVGEAFLGNTTCKCEIDHIDRDPQNNHVSNLRWVNSTEQKLNQGVRKNASGQKNIHLSNNGYDICFRRYNNVIFRKWVQTLEEAIKIRDAFLEREKKSQSPVESNAISSGHAERVEGTAEGQQGSCPYFTYEEGGH